MGELTPAQLERWRNRPLGAITESLEVETVLELAGELTGKRVLDVGTGDGTYALAAAARGASTVGIDVSEAMLTQARRRANEKGVDVDWRIADALALPFSDRSFDVVVAVTILCFVHDAERAIAEMARVLKPDGRLVMGELGRWNAWAAWRTLRGWLGSPTWSDARFRTARELTRLVERAGLVVQAVRGSVYHPPSATLARAIRPLDRRIGRITTAGAAFVALAAVRRTAGART